MNNKPTFEAQKLSCLKCNGSRLEHVSLDAYQYNDCDEKGLSMFIRNSEFDYSYGYFGKGDSSESTIMMIALCSNCNKILSFSLRVDDMGEATYGWEALGTFSSENPNHLLVA